MTNKNAFVFSLFTQFLYIGPAAAANSNATQHTQYRYIQYLTRKSLELRIQLNRTIIQVLLVFHEFPHYLTT